jgi:hypothetical protein
MRLFIAREPLRFHQKAELWSLPQPVKWRFQARNVLSISLYIHPDGHIEAARWRAKYAPASLAISP